MISTSLERAAALCIASVAIRFALAEEGVATTLVGTADPTAVEQNVGWAAAGPPEPAVLAEIQGVLAPVQDLSWPSGRPENGCSGTLRIPDHENPLDTFISRKLIVSSEIKTLYHIKNGQQ